MYFFIIYSLWFSNIYIFSFVLFSYVYKMKVFLSLYVIRLTLPQTFFFISNYQADKLTKYKVQFIYN
jgi:hypothetical protein